jgi:peptidyl-tRNA hydrolase, PTH1 family
MYTVIGLGNPGEKYTNTRHNAGFMALDALASKGTIEEQNVTFVKPKTMMNNSGDAVKKLSAKHLIVIHDDIDLPLGKIKISVGSGSAGHKGIESIIQQLKTNDFVRIRIGIQPKRGKPKQVERFVLKTFTKEEILLLEAAIQNTVEALDLILKQGVQQAMNQYNRG